MCVSNISSKISGRKSREASIERLSDLPEQRRLGASG